ncbi:MAG TPA: response regulator [bacterium]|nr:response regulator [bacterium]
MSVRRLPESYRIVLADPHAATREAIALVLRSEGGFEVAGSAATMEDAVRMIRETRPDVLIVDPWLFGPAGLPGCLAARQINPRLVIIALLPDDQFDAYHAAARAMGADAAVAKSRARRDLLGALRAVLPPPPRE